MNLRTVWIVLLFWINAAQAREGYEIRATLRPFQKGHLFLAHHYGKKQYLIDSAAIGANGEAVFRGSKPLFGGVYMIVFPEKNGWIECIIDQEQFFSVEADSAALISSTRFSGSADNTLFHEYQLQSYSVGTRINQLRAQGSGQPDSLERKDKIDSLANALQQYRINFIRQHPKHLLSAIFHLLKEPVIPAASAHPGGRYDSAFAFQFYKQQYWEGISFQDERLVRTPVFQPRLDRYFDQVLDPRPDSLILAADALLREASGNAEMFKFLLATLTDKYVNPAFMGQDAVFVHLFQKYYLAGKADSWMSEAYRKFIFDRGYSLMANTLGQVGADFPVLDTADRRSSLYAKAGNYTVLCFWDPTCSHCKEEIPKLDSLFQAKWKSQGIRMIGMMTEGGKPAWLEFIRRHNLSGWVHVYQTQEMKDADYRASRPGFRQLYDVYQTPMLYLLDPGKHIIAKKLNYLQLDEFLQYKLRTPGTQ